MLLPFLYMHSKMNPHTFITLIAWRTQFHQTNSDSNFWPMYVLWIVPKLCIFSIKLALLKVCLFYFYLTSFLTPFRSQKKKLLNNKSFKRAKRIRKFHFVRQVSFIIVSLSLQSQRAPEPDPNQFTLPRIIYLVVWYTDMIVAEALLLKRD